MVETLTISSSTASQTSVARVRGVRGGEPRNEARKNCKSKILWKNYSPVLLLSNAR